MVLMWVIIAPLTLALLLGARHSRQRLRIESSSRIAGELGGLK
jgi:hypothetical protein